VDGYELAGVLEVGVLIPTDFCGDVGEAALRPGRGGELVLQNKKFNGTQLAFASERDAALSAAYAAVIDHARLPRGAVPVERRGGSSGGGRNSGGGAPGVARLPLYLPLELWNGMYAWKRSAAAAVVFAAIRSVGGGDREAAEEEEGALATAPPSADRFTLPSVFDELPRCSEPALPPLLPAERAAPLSLGALPLELLRRVLRHLGPGDLARAAAACRGLRYLAAESAPGLRLTLFPHQRAAIRWFAAREAPPAELPHPFIRTLRAASGAAWFANVADGDASALPPPALLDVRGGLYADEPGLGKTISALALVLRDGGAGALPAPPPDAAGVEFCTDSRCARGRRRRQRFVCAPGCSLLPAASCLCPGRSLPSSLPKLAPAHLRPQGPSGGALPAAHQLQPDSGSG